MKDDTVSRAAAIDEAEEWIEAVYCEDGDQRERDAIRHVINGIKKLPAVPTCEDAVSRQAAIEVVKHAWAKGLEPTQYLEELPAVQTCDDAVSRQAAIDALNDEITITGKTNAVIVQDYIRRVNNRLHDLPSVQPQSEIVRCKDCKYADDDGVCQNSIGLVIQDDDDFCSRAERRTDE